MTDDNAELLMVQKQVTSRIHERALRAVVSEPEAYRNRPLSDEQKESNRQKSRIRARIENRTATIHPPWQLLRRTGQPNSEK